MELTRNHFYKGNLCHVWYIEKPFQRKALIDCVLQLSPDGKSPLANATI